MTRGKQTKARRTNPKTAFERLKMIIDIFTYPRSLKIFNNSYPIRKRTREERRYNTPMILLLKAVVPLSRWE